ncbi:MAG: Calcium-transporting ATPase [Pelotomaculum sp. PtaU1.Bin035]|nr:MAG: Calcium-transporting ATPase [Pelotomaculum sp. PtaU1.Bin035]
MTWRWYALTKQEVVEQCRTDGIKGLSDKEAKERASRFGPNELSSVSQIHLWQLFISQFGDPVVLMLLAGTAIVGFFGNFAGACAIVSIVIAKGIIGFIQVYRAEHSIELLKQLAGPEAIVIRDGRERKLPAVELVPGDIVLLNKGDRVPADLRLLQADQLEIEESALTGETSPVKKQEETLPDKDLAIGDTINMAYMGTVVTRGRGCGLVVRTGMAAEMGRIADMIREDGQGEMLLQCPLVRLGKNLSAYCLIIIAVVMIIGVMRRNDVFQLFLTGISLVAVANPGGLPSVVAEALAIGARRLIRRNVVIRIIPSLEALGCATVICADKSGTLTQNEMTVRKVVVGGHSVDVTGEGYDPKGEFTGTGERQGLQFTLFMKAAALCNNAVLKRGSISVAGLFRGLAHGRPAKEWSVIGDPTEGALLVMAAKAGFWRERLEMKEQRIAELPFNSGRNCMTVVYRQTSGVMTAYVKGAPELLLALCTHTYKGGMTVPLLAPEREEILAQNSRLAEQGLRLLAFACKEVPANTRSEELSENTLEQRLVFLGLAGMIDHLRPAAVKAIQICRKAGIKVVMITGDHQLTAQAIGRELGILSKGDTVLTGRDLDRMSEEQFREVADHTSVYARVLSKHKMQIVQALKQSGHIVAVAGSKFDDVPAVKEADIGITAGSAGTGIIKDVSSAVLADDDFGSIIAAVKEGRGTYSNIRKLIRYLISCSVGVVLTMFLAVLAGFPLPLAPVQVLWVNLIACSLPAMALNSDPYDHDIMAQPPRRPWDSASIYGLAWRIGTGGMVIGLGALAAFAIGLFLGEVSLASTMALNTLVFIQLFYVFTCRSENQTTVGTGIFTNPCLVGAVFISSALQLVVDYVPFLQPIFNTVYLNGLHWAIIMVISSAPTALGVLLRHLSDGVRQKVMYLKV